MGKAEVLFNGKQLLLALASLAWFSWNHQPNFSNRLAEAIFWLAKITSFLVTNISQPPASPCIRIEALPPQMQRPACPCHGRQSAIWTWRRRKLGTEGLPKYILKSQRKLNGLVDPQKHKDLVFERGVSRKKMMSTLLSLLSSPDWWLCESLQWCGLRGCSSCQVVAWRSASLLFTSDRSSCPKLWRMLRFKRNQIKLGNIGPPKSQGLKMIKNATCP